MIRATILLLTAAALYANVAVTVDSYHKIANDKVEVIYPLEYATLSQKVLGLESDLLKAYSASFGYHLDDTQYVGLLSSHNQVANAYSTQIPYNLQMNFPAGALSVDYFAGTSWIKTLLFHESTHNFQLNPKKNPLSYYTHKVLKNSFFTLLAFVPVFPVPNLSESSFILEGNAVLNESRHNNGGRLYNGSLLAMAITQARAGYITPERSYNNHLYFPYGAHHYIVGGFFQLYLAQKYGIDKVNSYFYNFSGQWIPLFTNSVFKETFGETFEEALSRYNAWILKQYKDFHPSKGKVLFHSKNALPLNSDAKSIYFLISDHLTAPILVDIDKETMQIKREKTAHPLGKVFKSKGAYYTRASAHTSPERIEVGLYDKNAQIRKESQGKAVQSLQKGEMVYFDIASSFDEPQMYVDGRFYAQVNSSVFTYHDKHYFFIQKGKKRTLYENHTPLFSYQGWYGFVCDRDANGIYFIANTDNGSGLYRYHDGMIERVTKGDDVVDARLIDAKTALVETMEAEGVSFKKVALSPTLQRVKEVRYFFEDDKRFDALDFKSQAAKANAYHAISNMHYASLSQAITTTTRGIDFDIAANFTDPLSQNSIKLFSSKSNKDVIAGVGYDSSAYRLHFGASLFGVLDHDNNASSRGFGLYSYMAYPLMHTLYKKMDLKLSYLLDDKREEKEPLTLSLKYSNHHHFGHSMYLNDANDIALSVGLDRKDTMIGGRYHFSSSFAHQWYGAFDMRGAYAHIVGEGKKHGIKLQQYQNRFADALNFEMPSLVDDIYVKSLANVGLSLYKVFDVDKYFFSFPISLRRESLYGKYNYYALQLQDKRERDFHEFTLGMTGDMLYFNSLALPISFEYIVNQNLANANHVRVLFELNF